MESETVTFADAWAASLEPYLPPPQEDSPGKDNRPQSHQPVPRPGHRPFTTLTYAQSLDSQIALSPGQRTRLSGPESKAMTHFLRARHDAILIGAGTAVADDPGLNCRLLAHTPPQPQQQHHPRPVVLDPGARWAVDEGSKVVQLARAGKGKGPWVLCAEGTRIAEARRRVVEGVGGRYIPVPATATGPSLKRARFAWDGVLAVLREEGVESLMVEGGAQVINELLELSNRGVDVVDSVIVTIAPVWLGSGGVTVAPSRPVDGPGRGGPGPRLGGVSWVQMGEDMVLCGRVS